MGVSLRAALAGAVLVAGAASPAGADRLQDLPGYERHAVETVLARRQLTFDPHPGDKRIGRIVVDNLDVFTERDRAFTLLNVMHATTTERTIEHEVLLRPGDRWDEELAEETARRLRDPELTAFVAVVPIENPAPDKVDVLVVTRDAWSLRTNSDFEFQEGRLTFLSLQPAENNFLGRRKRVGASFVMDQGAYTVGPLYQDPNIRSTHMQASAFAGLTFARDGNDLEGSHETASVGLPLWSLASRWGASLLAEHQTAIERTFQGGDLATYDAPETMEDDAIPRAFRLSTFHLALEGLHRFGDRVKSDVGLGYDLLLQRPRVPGDLEADPAAIAGFERDVLPRSELVSALVASYHLFWSQFVVYQNVNRYDLSEDRQLGPDLSLRVAAASRALGSDDDLLRADGALGWHVDLDGVAFLYARAAAGARYDGDGLSDEEVSGQLQVAGPPLSDLLRPIFGARFDLLFNDLENRVLTVGGDTGLRGYEVGAFMGEASALLNAELRTMPVPLASLRLGALAFWDAGHAAASFRELALRQDVGAGLRVLIPQAGSVLRLDWAFPVGERDTGFPGRVSAGFGQVF